MKNEEQQPEQEKPEKSSKALTDAELKQATGGTASRSGGSGRRTAPELDAEVYGSGS